MEAREVLELINRIDKLEATIQELITIASKTKEKAHRSENIADVAAAVALAQVEFEAIVPTKRSIDGSFADIGDIYKAISNALSKQGLKLIQRTQKRDEGFMLYTELLHKSGQWLSSEVQIILAATDKETGSHLDFHKRHQALSLLGIYPTGEGSFDDNGDAQYEKDIIKDAHSVTQAAPKKKHWETITKDQYNDLIETLEAYPQIASDIMERYGITTLKDMPKKQFSEDMKLVRELINKIERRY